MLPSLSGTGLAQSHFWTLEIELVFYLILASLFFIFGHLGRVIIGGGYLVSIFICLNFTEDIRGLNYWGNLPLYVAIMFYGASCRMIMQSQFSQSARWKRSVLLGVVTGVLAIIPIKTGYGSLEEGDEYFLESAGLLLSVILIFISWIIIRPVKIAWLASMGRWTYSVYLLHGAVLYFCSLMFKGAMPDWGYVGVTICLSFALGAAAYRWIEQPSDRIGKRIAG